MKKNILEINNSTVGSTGRIMFMVSQVAEGNGYKVYTSSAVHRNEAKINKNNHIYIGNVYDKKIHLFLAKQTGYNGCFSHITTLLFLNKLKKLKPDLIHIHNLHNCYINLSMLFKYIKKNKIPVVWTLHDCWAYTGHCAYYDYAQCNKWKTECKECCQLDKYPHSKIDKSNTMYKLKKEWFNGCNMTIVTPSSWLKEEVKKSFLKEYPVEVINNGIDLNIFKYQESTFRNKHNLKNKTIILGVASSWAHRKGLDIFEKIAIDEDLKNDYQVIIVGVTNEQAKKLPENIIKIMQTNNQNELAEIYSTADIFVNPTREENFPTTNIEALACRNGSNNIQYWRKLGNVKFRDRNSSSKR